MARIGIITGLKSEARAARVAGVTSPEGTSEISCAGADAGRARAIAQAFVAGGVDALISFGTAGGLAPDLLPGTVVVPASIRGAGAPEVPCDPAWRDRIERAISGQVKTADHDIAGSNDLIDDMAAKSALWKASGAGAVDMESRAVAEIATAARIPFVAIRAIADPASRAPPASALSLIAPDGGVRVAAAAATLLGKPSLIPVFRALARDNARALASLRRVALLCGPLFRFI